MSDRPSWRPPGLTPEVQTTILAALSLGHSHDSACRMARVPRTTVQRWIAKGRKQLDRWTRWDDRRLEAEGEGVPFDEPEPATTVLVGFFVDYLHAKASAVDGPLSTMRRASDEGDTQAARWLLARLEPDRWGDARAAGIAAQSGAAASTSEEVLGGLFERLAES